MLNFMGQFEAIRAKNLDWKLLQDHKEEEEEEVVAMDYSSFVDTSLDLNAKPPRVLDDIPLEKEVEGKFIDFGKMLCAKEETGALVKELYRVSAGNKEAHKDVNCDV